jgi:hypothetical protein
MCERGMHEKVFSQERDREMRGFWLPANDLCVQRRPPTGTFRSPRRQVISLRGD